MPTHATITDGEASTDKPIRQSLIRRLRDNPELVHAGDASVPSGKRIRVPQALRTDSMDSTKRLGPDGAGGITLLDAGGASATNGAGASTMTLASGARATLASIAVSPGAKYILTGQVFSHLSYSVGLPAQADFLLNALPIYVDNQTLVWGGSAPVMFTDLTTNRQMFDLRIVSGVLQLEAYNSYLYSVDYVQEYASLIGFRL